MSETEAVELVGGPGDGRTFDVLNGAAWIEVPSCPEGIYQRGDGARYHWREPRPEDAPQSPSTSHPTTD